MNEWIEESIKKKMLKDVDGTNFYIRRHRNGQETRKLVSDVKSIISEHNLSASEAKGFLEYMKMVIDNCSYLPQKK